VKLRLFCGLVILLMAIAGNTLATPLHLRCEYLVNPIGIDTATPQLSWESDNSERNWEQSAYQILVASNAEQLRAGKADIWDSGKTNSGESVGISYTGPRLQSRQRYYWKVLVWDKRGQLSESSESAWWEMGLLNPSDWKAQWITWINPDATADSAGIRWIWIAGQNALETPPKTKALFRTKINLTEKPLDAALMIVVRGDYVAKVNGHEVGRKSEWASFDRRDITERLVVGENTVEIQVTSLAPDSSEPNVAAKPVPAALGALVKISSSHGVIKRYPAGAGWEAKGEADSNWAPAQVVADLTDKRLGDPGPLPEPASYLRKTVELPGKVQGARLYVTALGSYRFFLNGERVGSDVLTPEFTDYRKRVLYQTYDVTSFLVNGKNALSAVLGDGWYGSGLAWSGTHFFAPPDRLIAQLEVVYVNGRHETFVTDASWKGSASPILSSEIYAGEVYDARSEQKGWESLGFDDSRWSSASVLEPPAIVLSSQISLPTQVITTLTPKSVTQSANGSYVFDMGQNIVGWTLLKVKGATGTRVRLRFAEILNPDGTIYTENLRNADATDLYILKGGEEEKFSPHFTFHGFRYVEVTGFPGKPSAQALTGEVVSSVQGEPTATVTTSNHLINQMWSIGLWGQRGNYLSIPTDCPQRDERLGWMGDAGVFWRTGSYNFDVAAFSQKFIQDITDAQTPQGAFTNVSPNTMPIEGAGSEGSSDWNEGMVGAPGWGDAGVIVPWTTWVQYGNKEVIGKNWNSMQRWLEFIQTRNPDFLRKNGVGPNFGDWLAPDEHTNKDLLATAYWALIANMMSEMARATGKEADAKHYADVVEHIREAFRKAYLKDNGVVGTGTQTSYVMALYTKMAPKDLEPALVNNLVKDIESRNWHLSTGFLGTPFLLFTLADHGRTDVAYRLLLNDTYPSWGYMLSKGATTWWERWNGDTGDPGMNSYNHYAFGSVVAWVYRYVAGIDTTLSSPGFKKVVIRPHPDPRLTFSKGEYESVYGKIVTEWSSASSGSLKLRVKIPANTTADIYLPANPTAQVTEGGEKVDAQIERGEFVIHIGSGTYEFEVK
jgi:alpha-L-rhamnosidase